MPQKVCAAGLFEADYAGHEGEGADVGDGELEGWVVVLVVGDEPDEAVLAGLEDAFDENALGGVDDIDLSPLEEEDVADDGAGEEVAVGVFGVHRGAGDADEEVDTAGCEFGDNILVAVGEGDAEIVDRGDSGDGLERDKRECF